MAEYVCAFCFKADQITESVRLSGWQGIKRIRPREDDPEKLEFSNTGDREALWDEVEGEGFHCAACETARPRLEEMVTAKAMFECRTCGWRGADCEEHPASCPETPERIDPLRPTPGQESLIPQNPGESFSRV